MEQTASDTSACQTPDSKPLENGIPPSNSKELPTDIQDLIAEEVKEAKSDIPLPPIGAVRRHKRSALRLSAREIFKHRHTEEQKKFLVRCSAEFIFPSEAKILFRQNFNIEPPDNLAALMHQLKKAYKWKPLFDETRKAYLEGLNEVPGAHKRVRMDRREKIYQEAMRDGQLKYALAATKDQEMEIEGPKRETVVFNQFNQYNTMTDEELEEKRQEILEKMNRKKSIDIGGSNGSSG